MPSDTFFRLPEEKRRRLLAAAQAEFARVPYDETSINRIIREAGIPRGSFYMYFQDKEDLFRYLLRDYTGWIGQQLLELLRREGGDLFAAFRGLFDRLTGLAAGSEGERMRQIAQVLWRNAGAQQGALLRSISPPALADPILSEIDASRLSREREEDLEEIVHILFSVTIPTLCAAEQEPAALVREHYLARLDILSRGMAAR